MKAPRKKIDANGWLTTYSDMITLVLCFFVLLYAMSSIDEGKWKNFVLSLNPDAQIPAAAHHPEDGDDTSQDDDEPKFEDIYALLQEAVQSRGLEDQIQVERGEEYAFVIFRDSIFFEGDKWNLLPRGWPILLDFIEIIDLLDNQIGEIRVLGHTTQARPDQPNRIRQDREISSNRACEVVIFVQERTILNARKLMSEGFGQHYPIAGWDTEEERAQNRRVEILIARAGAGSIAYVDVYNSFRDGR